MLKFLPSGVLMLLIAFSCNINDTIKAKAYIFERKLLADGSLMVCYSFNNDGVLMKDSSITKNEVIPQDSVLVVFQKNNPANSSIMLSRVAND
jgi:hypothetical protein